MGKLIDDDRCAPCRGNTPASGPFRKVPCGGAKSSELQQRRRLSQKRRLAPSSVRSYLGVAAVVFPSSSPARFCHRSSIVGLNCLLASSRQDKLARAVPSQGEGRQTASPLQLYVTNISYDSNVFFNPLAGPQRPFPVVFAAAAHEEHI